MASRRGKTAARLPAVREITPSSALEIRPTPLAEMHLHALDTFEYEYPGRRIEINFTSAEFTAICPFSDFPDFATLNIRYVPVPAMYRAKIAQALYQLISRNKDFSRTRRQPNTRGPGGSVRSTRALH